MTVNKNDPMRLLVVAVIVASTSVLVACKSNNFSGGDGKENPSPAPVVSAPPTTTPPPSASTEPCTGDGITKATLVTQSIRSKAASQFLDYDLSLTDCNGNPKALTNLPLKFDLNAVMNLDGSALPYQMSLSDGSSKTDGTLAMVKGSDLFGSNDPSYAHWETPSISYAAQNTVIRLRIDVSNRSIAPMGTKDGILRSSASIPSYLQVGTATPVQQNITVDP